MTPTREELLALAERVRGWRSGGQPLAEQPWIDWHGGECPVPAGTWVRIELEDDVRIIAPCEMVNWNGLIGKRIRITSGEEA